MSFRLIALTTLMLASVFGGEFIEPNPEFLRSFWKTLPVEEELPPEPQNSREKTDDATLPGESVRPSYTAPRPSLLFWGAMTLAAVTALLVVADILVLSRELSFRLRLKNALDNSDYRKVLGLLQHHFRKPPGTTLSQLADSIADTRLAGQLRTLEMEKYAPSNLPKKL